MDTEARALPRARFEHACVRMPALAVTNLVALGLLGVVARYTYEAFALPRPLNPVDIGAGGFPKLIAAATLVALGVLLASSILSVVTKSRSDWVVVRRPLFVLLASIAMVGQAVLFETFGVFVCVGLFALLTMVAAGERRPLHLLGTPAALALGIYVTFALALGVHFP